MVAKPYWHDDDKYLYYDDPIPEPESTPPSPAPTTRRPQAGIPEVQKRGREKDRQMQILLKKRLQEIEREKEHEHHVPVEDMSLSPAELAEKRRLWWIEEKLRMNERKQRSRVRAAGVSTNHLLLIILPNCFIVVTVVAVGVTVCVVRKRRQAPPPQGENIEMRPMDGGARPRNNANGGGHRSILREEANVRFSKSDEPGRDDKCLIDFQK